MRWPPSWRAASPASRSSAARRPGRSGRPAAVDHSLTGVSFAAAACTAVTGRIEGLRRFAIGHGQALARDLLAELDGIAPEREGRHRFAFLLVDGLFGARGAAGLRAAGGARRHPHGRRFGRRRPQFRAAPMCTPDGRFVCDGAVLVADLHAPAVRSSRRSTSCPPTSGSSSPQADPSRRVVREINGLPAAEEYARLLGVSASELGADPFRGFAGRRPHRRRQLRALHSEGQPRRQPDLLLRHRARRRPPRRHGHGPGRQSGASPREVRAEIGPPAARARLRLHPAQAGDRRDRPQAARERHLAA